jgi:hypothetical protein
MHPLGTCGRHNRSNTCNHPLDGSSQQHQRATTAATTEDEDEDDTTQGGPVGDVPHHFFLVTHPGQHLK